MGSASVMRAAAESIDSSGLKVVIVVDEAGRLEGLVTDGDIRRALLKGLGLDTPLDAFMTRRPRTAPEGTDREVLLDRLRHEQILHLPVVDTDGRIVDLAYLPELERLPNYGNRVVIMAGGLGTRLRPITETIPKPMVEVGGRPLIHTNVDMLVAQGFADITISLNYLGEVIEDYLGDGSRFGARISYVRETKRLGTGGALTLLPEAPSEPFVVMNGDILTSVDFAAMLRFHVEGGAMATMAVNKYTYNVPFGVVDVKDSHIKRLREKPSYDLFVNAGIYILSPGALELVPRDTFFDMPTLFETLMRNGDATLAFPLREHWLDIGQPDDLSRANVAFSEVQGLHARPAPGGDGR